MKQYVIDELRPWEHEKIKAYLENEFKASRVNGIYWIPLDADILTEVQRAHTGCQPMCDQSSPVFTGECTSRSVSECLWCFR